MTSQKTSVLFLNSRDLEYASCPSPEHEKKNMDENALKTQIMTGISCKKVTFNKLVYIREVMHVHDYSIEEKRDVWYQKFELDFQKQEVQETIRLIMQGCLNVDTNEHCARGLELRTRIGARKRRVNKLRVLAAVLDEQDVQFELSIIDNEMIAETYQRLSRGCKNEAIARGKLDRDDAYGTRGEKHSVSIMSFFKRKEAAKYHLQNIFKLRVKGQLNE
jgi:hypothetical protein